MYEQLLHDIRQVDEHTFDALALRVFQYQAAHNPVYGEYLHLLGRDPALIQAVEDIPFLPISFFKSHVIKTGAWEEEAIFTSSATTGQVPSKHLVRHLDWYMDISILGFEQHYGAVSKYCYLALLPSYLERSGSSLVYMVENFIRKSKYTQSGFYLYDIHSLKLNILALAKENIPTLLIGVSFALLDVAEANKLATPNLLVMETGGMKGRRKEITRQELHQVISDCFSVEMVHSEYGMTELLSQAYSMGEGRFKVTPTMRVMMRQINDPLALEQIGKTGVINIIDLANVDTCSFIATDDLGRKYDDETFEVLGRLDFSEIRGCNLIVGNI